MNLKSNADILSLYGAAPAANSQFNQFQQPNMFGGFGGAQPQAFQVRNRIPMCVLWKYKYILFFFSAYLTDPSDYSYMKMVSKYFMQFCLIYLMKNRIYQFKKNKNFISISEAVSFQKKKIKNLRLIPYYTYPETSSRGSNSRNDPGMWLVYGESTRLGVHAHIS